MSGFSPEWLRLREPADHRARDRGLVAQLSAYLEHFPAKWMPVCVEKMRQNKELEPRFDSIEAEKARAGRQPVRLVDLGCGTGSNLRALSPALPAAQQWRLVDYDRALLDAARAEIAAWSGAAPEISFEAADLSRDLDAVLAPDCDVVTAAALFDLVSVDWLERFVAALASRPRAFYTVLIYDGFMDWRPAHPADEAIRTAFNAHQRTDKGFGAAAGPEAGAWLAKALRRAGFDVRTAPSPWVLTRSELPLILAVADGVAEAARQTGGVADTEIADWLASRPTLTGCTVGHIDMLALP